MHNDGKSQSGAQRQKSHRQVACAPRTHRCNVNANESDVGQKNAGEARIDNDSSSRDATCIPAKPTSAKGTATSGARLPRRDNAHTGESYDEVVLIGVNAAEQQRR
jgi:hypothetical protein